MALQLPIEYEQVVELVKQLSNEQQNDLIIRLLSHQAKQRNLSVVERLRLLDLSVVNIEVVENPSVNRTDWYGDDGR